MLLHHFFERFRRYVQPTNPLLSERWPLTYVHTSHPPHHLTHSLKNETHFSPHRQRIRRVRRPLLDDIPMLPDTRPLKPIDVHHRARLRRARLILPVVHPAAIGVEALVDDGAVGRARRDRREGVQHDLAARREEGVVLDVVLGHVVEQRLRRVLLDQELLHELGEDGLLLGGRGRAGRAVGRAAGWGRVVVGWWPWGGGRGGGEEGQRGGGEGGDVHFVLFCFVFVWSRRLG